GEKGALPDGPVFVGEPFHIHPADGRSREEEGGAVEDGFQTGRRERRGEVAPAFFKNETGRLQRSRLRRCRRLTGRARPLAEPFEPVRCARRTPPLEKEMDLAEIDERAPEQNAEQGEGEDVDPFFGTEF